MIFYEFMMESYLKSRSQAGCLARDMRSDRKNFLRVDDGGYSERHKRIRAYLEKHGADMDCLDAFEDCWKEYVDCENETLNELLS